MLGLNTNFTVFIAYREVAILQNHIVVAGRASARQELVCVDLRNLAAIVATATVAATNHVVYLPFNPLEASSASCWWKGRGQPRAKNLSRAQRWQRYIVLRLVLQEWFSGTCESRSKGYWEQRHESDSHGDLGSVRDRGIVIAGPTREHEFDANGSDRGKRDLTLFVRRHLSIAGLISSSQSTLSAYDCKSGERFAVEPDTQNSL